MAPPSQAVQGKAPTSDGEINRYTPSTGAAPASLSNNRVIYINGVLTSGEAHKETAVLIADVTEGYVYGVHNLSGTDDSRAMLNAAARAVEKVVGLDGEGGMTTKALKSVGSGAANLFYGLQDFSQCIVDWALPMRAMKWVSESILGDWFPDTFRPPTKEDRYQTALFVLGSNKATVELFKLVYANLAAGKQIHLIAHSQGNLISVNALYAVQWALGSLKGLYYYGLASPSPSWPKELQGALYTHEDDPVPLASLGRSYSKKDAVVQNGTKILPYSVAAHDVTSHILSTPFGKLIRERLGLPNSPQPAAGATAGAARRPGKQYVVKSGDSLSQIAKQHLGNTSRWQEIYNANKSVIGTNPNRISPGMKLVLPNS